MTRSLVVTLGLLAFLAAPVAAHDGPPYPIIVDRPTGPAVLSVWADPDVGIGTFYVYLEPLDDETPIPPDAAVEITVWPKSGRLEEASFPAEASNKGTRDKARFYCEVDFDRQEWWVSRFEVSGAGESETVEIDVEVTPPGSGPVLDFILYLFPFAAVGALIVRGIVVGRNKPAPPAATPSPDDASPVGDDAPEES
ncbi:MAG: hypothetical protein ACF8XB_25770 [Planctomycetota bacterium JB042]